MKKITLKCTFALQVLLFFGYVAVAQVAPSLSWQASFGFGSQDFADDVIATTDGGYLTTGYSNVIATPANHTDFYVVKTNSAGVLQWQFTYGGPNADSAKRAIQTTDGGYLIAGESESPDWGGATGAANFVVIKISAEGTLLWSKNYGGSGAEHLNSFEAAADGGYVLCGTAYSNDVDVTGNHGQSDIWVVKLDADCNLLWQQCLGTTTAEFGYMAKQTTDGGFIVLGMVQGGDYGVYKLDNLGSIVWQDSYGGSDLDIPDTILATADGDYIIAGQTRSTDGDITNNNGDADIWIVKLNSTGGITWQSCYGGFAYEAAGGIIATTSGYVIAGATSSIESEDSTTNAWLLKINLTGDVLWNGVYGGTLTDSFYGLIETSAGLTVAGASESADGDITQNFGGYDFWLAHFAGETTGVTTISKNTFNLYPNPNNGTFTINADTDVTNAAISVYSALGQLVYTGKVTGTTVAIPNLSAGVYQVQLTTGQAAYSQKLVIK
jgi:hypothetical protein